jgi:hypothetical protein
MGKRIDRTQRYIMMAFLVLVPTAIVIWRIWEGVG